MLQFAPPSNDAVQPRLQRARGAGDIVVEQRDGATRLRRLYQDGCAKLRLPRDADAVGAEAVMINTAGGLTGGDRMAWRAEAGAGSSLTLTSQACERVYRAIDEAATVDVQLSAGAGAALHWLPQETILFDQGALSRSIEVELASNAKFLAVEAVILGRTAMGEQVRRGTLRDRWRVRREGRLVFADDIRLEGEIARVTEAAPLLAGGCAFAAILWVADDAEQHLAAVRAALGDAGGASAFDGKLFARVTARDGRALRRALIPAIEALRDGRLPRVWRS